MPASFIRSRMTHELSCLFFYSSHTPLLPSSINNFSNRATLANRPLPSSLLPLLPIKISVTCSSLAKNKDKRTHTMAVLSEQNHGKPWRSSREEPDLYQNIYLSEWGLESENGRRLLQTQSISYGALQPDIPPASTSIPGQAYTRGCQARYYCRDH